jgi:hypothetical protein
MSILLNEKPYRFFVHFAAEDTNELNSRSKQKEVRRDRNVIKQGISALEEMKLFFMSSLYTSVSQLL